MGTVLVRRRSRRTPPAMPSGEMKLESPPELPERSSRMPTPMVLLMAMLPVSSTAFLVLATNRDPLLYLGIGLYALAMAGLVTVPMLRYDRARAVMREERVGYLRYLGEIRGPVREHARMQRAAQDWSNPPPGLLWSMPLTDRLWERRPGDQDFGQARIGSGSQAPEVSLIAPDTAPIDELEPLSTGSLRRFLHTHRVVPDLPVSLPIDMYPRVRLTGDRAAIEGMVRAMLMQLATFHSPDDLRISLCAAADRMSSWEWLKWLPHARHPVDRDAAGLVRLVAPSLDRLERMLGPDVAERGLHQPASFDDLPLHVMVLDGGQVPARSRLAAESVSGVCVLDLGDAFVGRGELTLDVRADRMQIMHKDRPPEDVGRPDQPSIAQAEALARQFAALRPDPAMSGHGPAPSLAQLCRAAEGFHAPLGVDPDGAPVTLDVTAGDTYIVGDERIEVASALVLGLALMHPPDRLNLVLLSPRRGVFTELAGLPHVCAVAEGLADDHAQRQRIQQALSGEVSRRERAMRNGGPEPPRLIVLADDAPGLGPLSVLMPRSSGVHLVLAVRRLRQKRSGAPGNRVALRLPPPESQLMVGSDAAAHLPPQGYALVDADPEPVRVRLAQLAPAPSVARDGVPRRVVSFRLESTGLPPDWAPEHSPIATIVEQVDGTPARPLLAPALDRPPTLKGILPALRRSETLEAAAGLLDNPLARLQEPYTLDLLGAAAHIGVIGRARSGKTTLLRTLVASLALRYGPDMVRFHLVGTAEGLGPLSGLPHVAETTPYEKDGSDIEGLADRLRAALARRNAAEATILVVDDWPETPDADELTTVVLDWHVRSPWSHLVISARSWSLLHPELAAMLKFPLELRLDDPQESRIDGQAAAQVPVRRPGRGLTIEGLHFLAAMPRIDGVRSAEAADEALAALVRHVRETR
jgi:S-DNA-T family DNA segregation ATPase FtsK/SpoIIIE